MQPSETTPRRGITGARFGRVAALGAALVLALGACAPRIHTYGYIPPAEEVSQIVPGIDTRATVEDVLGPPSATGVSGSGSYYYVGSTTSTLAFFAPRVIEREVIAVSFDGADVVQDITRYGLEDGRVVALSPRITETSDGEISFIRKLFGNIGGLDAGGLLNN
ncbi:outer membrane protein assembly factor BamE [Litorisediminicola beolgyonensis]|uniref:Outer membrane protein assembly factor BamE n=1 Tax=Litorisediminicola beolgyonensis TaxID=1173614 RepID=A0ABW3ZFP0_9RHOB